MEDDTYVEEKKVHEYIGSVLNRYERERERQREKSPGDVQTEIWS